MCISVLGEASVTAEPPSSKTWGAAQAIDHGRQKRHYQYLQELLLFVCSALTMLT
jgi:hypothetical protein